MSVDVTSFSPAQVGRYLRTVCSVVLVALLETLGRFCGGSAMLRLQADLNNLCLRRAWPLRLTAVGVEDDLTGDSVERVEMYRELLALAVRRVESAAGQIVVESVVRECRSSLAPLVVELGEAFDLTRIARESMLGREAQEVGVLQVGVAVSSPARRSSLVLEE
jgi:hypothetical protein